MSRILLMIGVLASVICLGSAVDALAQKTAYDPFAPRTGDAPSAKGGVIANAEFVNSPINVVFKMVSDITGWSIVMSPEVSKQPPKINIWIKNLTPEQVLQQVVTMGGLVMRRTGNTIDVMSFDEYAKLFGIEKRALDLKHADAKAVAASLEPFIDKKVAKIVADTDSNKIILLVPEPLLTSLIQLVEVLDVPPPFAKDVVRVVRVKHLEAATLAPLLEEFLKRAEGTASQKKAGPALDATGPGADEATAGTLAGEWWVVRMMVETKLNAIVLRGSEKDVQKTVALIESLDVPSQIYAQSYLLKFTNARDVFETVRDILEERKRLFGGGRRTGPLRLQVALSEQNNRILVEGSRSDHDYISAVIAAIDKPIPAGSGGTRVYRLQNATSSEVAKVIQDLIEQRLGRRGDLAKQERKGGDTPVTHDGRPAASSGTGGSSTAASSSTSATTTGQGKELAAGDILPPQVTDAPEINAVIIRASAVEQEEFAVVIEELDRPREQVLIEVTLVSVRSDEGFNLGLELGGARIAGSGAQAIGFNHFGIGTVDSRDGTIRIDTPSPFGLNFALFNSDDFSLVLNALKTIGDARITSAPKVLVEDNAQAFISRQTQEPYESTSQGDATTVTSFGGYIDAGTDLTVTPHISNKDWLRLEYQVGLSSFGVRTDAQEAANLPPPRRTNVIQGTVRIPSDHMVVLGGLVNTREDESISAIPFISEIPIIGELAKNREQNQVHETLFIFIRPAVLRDPAFKDLLGLSADDVRKAKVAQDDGPDNPLKLTLPDAGNGAKEVTP